MFKDDDLYGEGDLTSNPNFIVKAQLRVQVRPLPIPAAQGIVDRLVAAYRDRLALMQAEIETILGRASTAKSMGLCLVGGGDDIFKAKITGAVIPKGGVIPPSKPKPPSMADDGVRYKGAPKPGASGVAGVHGKPREDIKSAGSRGGKFYRDKHGKVRYGIKPPEGEHTVATPQQVAEHFKHMRPSLFLNSTAPDIKAVIFEGQGDNISSKYFTEDDINLLKWWEDAGFDAYKNSHKLKDKDLEGDVSGPKVEGDDGSMVSHEQGIREFILFNADQFGMEEQEVSDALDDIFKRYDEALHDPVLAKVAEQEAAKIEEKTNAFFIQAEGLHEQYSDLVSNITNSTDPETTLNQVVIAMASMPQSLVFKPGKGETGKKGSLKGLISPNGAVLDDKDGWLVENSEQLGRLNAGQLAAVYVASQLNQRWDPDMKKYDDASAVGPSHESNMHPLDAGTKLGGLARDMMLKKLGVDVGLFNGMLGTKLDEITGILARKFNDANSGTDPFVKKLFDIKADAIKDASKIEELQAEQTKWAARRDAALAAQEGDPPFEMPITMMKGVMGAMGKSSGEAHQLAKDGTPMGLFKHQRQSIEWMGKIKRGLLALDAGMGKTPTLIAFMEQLKQKEGPDSKNKRAILFLPPSLMAQWPNEIRKYAPGSGDKILNLSGLSLAERKIMLQSDMAKKAEYIIISSGTLTDAKPSGAGRQEGQTDLDDDGTGGSDNEIIELLKSMDGSVFIDEAHQGGFKNADGVRHKLAKQVMEGREYAFGLTATPMPNHPIDLFHLTNLFAPGSVGDANEWEGSLHGSQFNSDTQSWEVTNPDNIVDLNKRVKPFVFSKLITDPAVVEDMKKGLPAITSEAIDIKPSNNPCPVTGLSQFDYLRPGGAVDLIAAKRMEEIDAEREAAGKEPLSAGQAEGTYRALKMTLQRQCAISPGMIDPKYKGDSPKIMRLVDDLVSHFQGGAGTEDKPIVIFSSYPKKAFPLVQAELVKRGIDPALVGIISGEKNAKDRAFEQDMTNTGKRKVLLVGTMSGGAGLNLQEKSNKMMFLDEPWHPAAKRQAQGRVWRTGQTNAVSMNTYRVEGSFDMNIESKIAGKQTMVSAMLGKPDPDAFKDNASAAIKELGGRVAPTGMSDAQMAHMMGTMKQFSGNKDFMGEDYEGEGGDSDTLADPDKVFEKHTEKNPKLTFKLDAEANKKLKEKAGHLADSKFDESAERSAWDQKQRAKNVVNDHEVQLNLAQAHKANGDHGKAAASEKKAAQMQQDYPEAFGKKSNTKVKGKPAAPAPKGKPAAPAPKAVKEKAAAPAKVPAKTAPATKTKPEKLAHDKPVKIKTSGASPWEKNSGKKVPGTDGLTHHDMHSLYSQLKKYKTPERLLNEFIKPNTKGYSDKWGKKFMEGVVAQFRSKGLVE